MRVIGAMGCALALALAVGPAVAQMPVPSFSLSDPVKTKTPEQIEQEEAKEKAYRESLKKIPNAKTSNDPWGGVRDADGQKPATAAKPKAKTGAAGN